MYYNGFFQSYFIGYVCCREKWLHNYCWQKLALNTNVFISHIIIICSSFGALKNYLNRKHFLLLLKQISKGLHFLHKDLRNENQRKYLPLRMQSLNEKIFFKISIMLLYCYMNSNSTLSTWFISKQKKRMSTFTCWSTHNARM